MKLHEETCFQKRNQRGAADTHPKGLGERMHDAIIQSIKTGDLSSVSNLLEQNWMSSTNYILSELQR